MVIETFYPQNYNDQKQAVLELYTRYLNIRNRENDGVDLKFLQQRVETLKASKYLLAVVGQAKSGKSKFINALLGKDIVPTDVKQCTSGIIEIIESNTIYLDVKYANGRVEKNYYNNVEDLNKRLRAIAAIQEKYRPIPIIAINDFLIQYKSKQIPNISELTVQEFNWENIYKLEISKFILLIKDYINEYKGLEKITKKILVGHPLGYEFTQMRLVDTPGIEARGGIDQVTLDFISQANAAILVHPYKNVGNSSLYNFYTKNLQQKYKESIFLFLTHKAHLGKIEDRKATIEEAKGLFPEVAERTALVDSMLKLIYEDLCSGKSIKDIRTDEDKKLLIANYIVEYGDDIQKIKESLLEDSSFVEVTKMLKSFSRTARGLQLKEIIDVIYGGYTEQKTVYSSYIKLNENKIEKTPIEFALEIESIKSILDDYQKTLNDFSLKKSKDYKGSKGIFTLQFNTLQDKYSPLILGADERLTVEKYLGDFNYECDKIITAYCNDLDKAYTQEMSRVGMDFLQKHFISPPKINVGELAEKAQLNAYDTIKIEGSKTSSTLWGAAYGITLGFMVGGPIGAIFGGIAGAYDGNVSGKSDEYTTQYNSAKFIDNLKTESNTLIRTIVGEMSNTLGTLFDNYDEEFRAKLKLMIHNRKSTFDELKNKENEQVPIYNQIEDYKKKITVIDSDLSKIETLFQVI